MENGKEVVKSETHKAYLDDKTAGYFMEIYRTRHWKGDGPIERMPGVWAATRVEETLYCAGTKEKLEEFLNCECGARIVEGKQVESLCHAHGKLRVN